MLVSRTVRTALCRIKGLHAPPPLLPRAQNSCKGRSSCIASLSGVGQPCWPKPAPRPAARSRQAAMHRLQPSLYAQSGETRAQPRPGRRREACSRRAARGARRACQASRSCQKVMRPALSEDTSGVPCGLHAVQSTLAAPASLSVATTAPARSACCARGAPAPAPRQPAAACAPGCVRWGMQGCQDNGLTLTCCHSGCNELKIRSFNTHIIPG